MAMLTRLTGLKSATCYMASTLRQNDAYLNRNSIISASSIHYLANQNLTAQTHADLIRGPNAFGTLLGNAGYPSVPSQQIPFPDTGQAYFDGGYNTARWASRDSGTIDGFQLETYYTGLRDNQHDIRKFTDSLAVIIKKYLDNMFYPGFTLPVSLIDFTGIYKNGSINLAWHSVREINLKDYEVERSSNGKDFSKIGTVKAGGEFYKFTDNKSSESVFPIDLPNVSNPARNEQSKNVFYRLKMVNKDGTAPYSKIIAINTTGRLKLTIAPNPVTLSFTVSHAKAGRGAFIKILSSSGQLLQTVSVRKGSYSTTVKFASQQNGTYMAAYFDGNEVENEFFVK